MKILLSLEQVFPILLEQCDIVATRMRRQQKKCLSVAVTFRTLDFKKKSHQATFQSATDVTDEIYKQAKKLFREFWKGEHTPTDRSSTHEPFRRRIRTVILI